MDYALAKQLKDAGFPQDSLFKSPFNDVAAPTLEEIIEACGDSFWELHLTHTGHDNHRAFYAQGATDIDTAEFSATPTEAVARLWLALHSKK